MVTETDFSKAIGRLVDKAVQNQAQKRREVEFRIECSGQLRGVSRPRKKRHKPL
jgi:hypothetical protein